LLLEPLSDWNQTHADYPCDCTIPDLFKQQVLRTPDATAVITAKGGLTYRELDLRTNGLARYLQNLGVTCETMVGLAIERSEEMLIALLAILKAGGTYVPLDPSHPQARVSQLIEDARLSWILTTQKTRSRIPGSASRLLFVDSEIPAIAAYSDNPVLSNVAPENLAYLIYTSGSTGKPKGVMIEHRNVINFFTGMDHAIGRSGGVWLAVTSISFDISVLELLWTLTRGYQVVIHGDEGSQTIPGEIARYGVTHLQMTPSLARMLAMDANSLASLTRLKQLLLGGEALPSSLVAKLRSVYEGEIFNMYGPTETTVWSTTYKVQHPCASISIGRPIDNTQIYLLDDAMNPVPVGETAELYIGGDGVVRGYWNRPDLTAERFLDDPFRPGTRMYRTGDLARYLPDGNLEYLGRADFQIKIRGFRIEPGEIEAVLEQQPGVTQAAVIVREDRPEDKRLVAYLTLTGSQEVTAESLRLALAAKLPAYMVPSSFVFLDAMPLTDNLKLDRKSVLRLPPPKEAPASYSEPPRNNIERIIASAWEDALGLDHIGLEQAFFDLGAHSLTVAEVHSRTPRFGTADSASRSLSVSNSALSLRASREPV
jgi:amino acid adenylation domain-containing protein